MNKSYDELYKEASAMSLQALGLRPCSNDNPNAYDSIAVELDYMGDEKWDAMETHGRFRWFKDTLEKLPEYNKYEDWMFDSCYDENGAAWMGLLCDSKELKEQGYYAAEWQWARDYPTIESYLKEEFGVTQ